MKPSDFKKHPWSCRLNVSNLCEHEIVARNCMVILSDMGDEWRALTWEEYAAGRQANGDGLNSLPYEKRYFEKVVEYTTSPAKAAEFSHEWENIYNGLKTTAE